MVAVEFLFLFFLSAAATEGLELERRRTECNIQRKHAKKDNVVVVAVVWWSLLSSWPGKVWVDDNERPADEGGDGDDSCHSYHDIKQQEED